VNSLCALVLTACLFCIGGSGAPVFGERDPLFHGGGGIIGPANDFVAFSILPDGSTLVNAAPYLANGERNTAIPYYPRGQIYTSDGRVLSNVSGPLPGTTLLIQERVNSPGIQSVLVAGEVNIVAQNISGLLIFGNFTAVAGIPRSKIAALDNNLNVTPLFGSTTLTTGYVSGIVVMPDGAILIGGSSFGEAMLFRFFPDGVPDTSFVPAFTHDPASQYDAVTCITPQPDGKLLIATSTPINTTLIRLLSDGLLDTSFHTDKPVVSAVLQFDGRIVCLSSDQCFRLNSDGTLDARCNVRSWVGHRFIGRR
jgi:hypothetical protein